MASIRTYGVTSEGSHFEIRIHGLEGASRVLVITKGSAEPPERSDEEETTTEILGDKSTMSLLDQALMDEANGRLRDDRDVRKQR